MAQAFYYTDGEGEEHGPVSAAELKQAARDGVLKPTGKVRKEGGGWTPASQVKGLFPDIHDHVREAAGHVEKAAKTASKAAKAVGEVADAVSDAAEAGEKLQKALTAVLGLSAGVSTLLGGVGDFLRPLGPVNLIVAAAAVLAAAALLVAAWVRGWGGSAMLKLGGLASLAVALVFGLWSGAGAVGGKDDKGVLASNIPAVERAQASVLPAQQPPPVERPVPSDEEKAGEACRFDVPPALFRWVAFSPDGKRVLYCGLSPSTGKTPRGEHWLIEWDWEGGKELRRVALPAREFGDAAFSTDRKWLILSTQVTDGSDILWDVGAGREARPLPRPGRTFARASFTSGKYAVLCSFDAVARVDTGTGKLVRRFEGADVSGSYRLATSPDGRLAYTAAAGRPAQVWDAVLGKPLREVGGPQRTQCRPAFAPDGRHVLDGGKGDVRLWDVGTGKEAGAFQGLDEFHCAAFGKDGKLLVTAHAEADSEGGLRVWDVAARKEVVRLKGHSGRCGECVDISPDGRHAVSSGEDGTVRVWRLPKAGGKQAAPPPPEPAEGEKGWIPLMDTQEKVQEYWKQGDRRGSFLYDPGTRTIRTKSPFHAGTFSRAGSWGEFRVEVEALSEPRMKSQPGFKSLQVNKTTLDLGDAFRVPKGPVRVTVRYDPRAHTLTALLGDKVVDQATVAGKDWNKAFRCEFHGGNRLELAIRDARLLPDGP